MKFCLAALMATASADVPAHCPMSRVAGEWTFSLSPPSATRQACGHTKPMDVHNALRSLDTLGGVDSTLRVNLTAPDGARTPEGVKGSWVNVYTQAVQVAILDYDFFAYSSYRHGLEAVDCDQDDNTQCHKTVVGFYENSATGEYGCWIGERELTEDDQHVIATPQFFIGNDEDPMVGDRDQAPFPRGNVFGGVDLGPFPLAHEGREKAEALAAPALDIASEDHKRPRKDDMKLSKGKKAKAPGRKRGPKSAAEKVQQRKYAKQMRRYNGLMSAHTSSMQARLDMLDSVLTRKMQEEMVATINALPNLTYEAAVYDQFTGMTFRELEAMTGAGYRPVDPEVLAAARKPLRVSRPRKVNAAKLRFLSENALPKTVNWRKYLDPSMSQGRCGSCYGVAAAHMISARRRIAAGDRKMENVSDGFLSHCSQYTHGCKGGYSELTGRFARDVGFVDQKCMAYSDIPNCHAGLDVQCVRDTEQHWKVSEHSYVGGHIGGGDERSMMEELAKNGPLTVSINTSPNFRSYKSGIFDDGNHPENGTEWARTTHAVIITGYGETRAGQKFWNVQNTWGADWGDKGFFKIRRGVNSMAVELMASYSTVVKTDGARMGAFLDEVEAEQKVLKAQAVAQVDAATALLMAGMEVSN